MLACLDHATRTGHQERVVALTAALAALLQHDGPWSEAITRHLTAIQAARRVGDRLGEARALNDLGVVRLRISDYALAAQASEEALNIYRDLHDKLGQACALHNLGAVRQTTDDFPGAPGH